MRMPPEELARRFAEADLARVTLRRATMDMFRLGQGILEARDRARRDLGPARSGHGSAPRR